MPWTVIPGVLGGLESGSGSWRRVQGPGPPYHPPQILGSCQGTSQEAGEREHLSELPEDMSGLSREVRAHRPDPKYSWLSGGWREAPGASGAQTWPRVVWLCLWHVGEGAQLHQEAHMCAYVCGARMCGVCTHSAHVYICAVHACVCMCVVPAAAGVGTSAGLLLGTECVALVAQAGVGAGQVLAARLPAGIRICTLIYVCKTTQRTTAVSRLTGRMQPA